MKISVVFLEIVSGQFFSERVILNDDEIFLQFSLSFETKLFDCQTNFGQLRVDRKIKLKEIKIKLNQSHRVLRPKLKQKINQRISSFPSWTLK